MLTGFDGILIGHGSIPTEIICIQFVNTNRQADIQTDMQTGTYRVTDREIGRQTDWQTDRPIDRHVHLHNSSNLLRCIYMCAQNTVRRWFSSVSGQSHSVSCGALLPVIGYTRTETEKSRVMQVSLLLPFKFTVSKYITAKEYIGNSKVLARVHNIRIDIYYGISLFL